MFRDFRSFLARGNVLDLAVAVILGVAFGAIITSLVNDILMPVIGVLLGGVDFTTLSIQIGQASINYGNFIQAVVNFLIIAFVIFLIVRAATRVQKQKEAALIEPSNEEKLLIQIRDLLQLNLKR
jgi:large conductance mechanosensitive channel